MNISDILKTHRELIIRDWTYLLHTEANQKLSAQTADELSESLKEAVDAYYAVLVNGEYSIINKFIENTVNIKQQSGLSLSDFQKALELYRSILTPIIVRELDSPLLAETLERVNQCLAYSIQIVSDKFQSLREQEFVHNITELEAKIEKTTRGLVESENKFNSLTEKSLVGIYLIQDGVFKYVNPRFAEILKYDKTDEIIDKKGPKDIVHPEDIPLVEKNIEKRISGEVYSHKYDFRIITKDNNIGYVEIYSNRTTYQNKPAVIGTLLDITDRKKIEQKADEEKQTFANLAGNAPFGMALFDKNGKFTYINSKFKEIFGYDLSEVPDGKTWCKKVYPDPEYRHKVIAVWLNDVERFRQNPSLREGKQWTFTVTCKDNRQKIINFIPVQLPTGAYLMTYEDITEFKQLQAQFIRAQKQEAIGTLAGGIAHDFNNLLTGIKMHAYLGKQLMDQENPAYLKFKSIEDIVDSAANLTKQFLGFAKGGKYEVMPIDLNNTIDRIATFFGRTRKEISIHKEYQKPLWTTEADESQIEQVLLNLFINAQHAMPNGGNIYIKTDNVTNDEIRAEPYPVKPGKYIKVSVTDTGTGIDEKIRDKIFEPFFTTKERGIGTGLGLASVYGIVKNHGGYITVNSTLGKGSTFIVYLPASDMKAVKGRTTNAKLMAGTEEILLVDDEKDILAVTNALLEALGYRVYAADNFMQAIKTYRERKNRIALVILDLIMPGMDGDDIFENLKKINPDVKVILATGYGMNEKIQNMLKKGCKAFIQKPYDLRAMSVMIRNVLDNKDISQ